MAERVWHTHAGCTCERLPELRPLRPSDLLRPSEWLVIFSDADFIRVPTRFFADLDLVEDLLAFVIDLLGELGPLPFSDASSKHLSSSPSM